MSARAEKDVRAVVERFVDSWNRHDMRLLADQFTEDGDFIDVFGNRHSGRAAIDRGLSQRHATFFNSSRFTEKEVGVRMLGRTLAVVQSLIELTGAKDGQGQQLPASLGMTLFVIAKSTPGWQIVVFQNTAVGRPILPPN